MNELARRIYENREEYNRLFIELANKFKEPNSGLLENTRSVEIDNLLKSIDVVKSNLQTLEAVEVYLNEEDKRLYGNG